MGRILVRILAVIGGLSLVGLAALAVLVMFLINLATAEKPLPDTVVLRLDLDRDLAEGGGPGTASRLLFGNKATFRDVLDGLERAGDDPHVKGVYARLGDDVLGLARTQELRDALAAFRAKGKFAVAFADTFGEFGPGTRPYYLATAFDEIWLQPMGDVGLTGLFSSTPFVRQALDRLGVVPSFDKRREYKTAMNSLTETAMTPPQREEIDGLLTSLDGQIVRDIAAARKISEPDLRALIDRAPLIADEAKAGQLVDRLGYRDEATAAARQRAGTGAHLVGLSRYLGEAGRPNRTGTRIALIYGTGLITRQGAGGRAFDEDGLDANRVAAAFREAVADKDVRAILFRIDSRGGSVVASETVWREVERARQRGKPVVVSMGDVAGSGGYYIAAPADKIVAEPATLTGSIGVIAGKLVFAGLFDKLGIAFDTASRGANAGAFSTVEDFSPGMRQRLSDLLDHIYDGFKAHVIAGRHLSADAVEALAKGRVWSGAEAKDKGLVDALGGYAVALGLVREAVKLSADAPVDLVEFPRRKGTLAQLFERVTGEDDGDGKPSSLMGARLGAVLAFAARVEALLDPPGTVEMPPADDIR